MSQYPCPQCGGRTRVLVTRIDLRERRCDKCERNFHTIEQEFEYKGRSSLAALKRNDIEQRKGVAK